MARLLDSFGSRQTLRVGGAEYAIASLAALDSAHREALARLPVSLKVLLENLLRREDGRSVTRAHVEALLAWSPDRTPAEEIAFMPARVLLQDFTGVPAVVDLAGMRDATAARGRAVEAINPLVPVDLVIDHSVQVDDFGHPGSFARNVALEYERNRERYEFLRWGARAFRNFRVVPPGTGIVHQINLEYLASCVFEGEVGGGPALYPDTVVGTDSHTTMINGLGVLGWGVGGIEAEAAMLGQPMSMLIPEVVGLRLRGRLRPGVTATDLVLTVTRLLRGVGVVGRFVEFFGPGLSHLSLADRATLANMAPEYGATVGFFPVDELTLEYLRRTNRPAALVERVRAYLEHQGLFWTPAAPEPACTRVVELDLDAVVPSLAGPKRPQDLIPLDQAADSFRRLRAAVRPAPDGGGGTATQAAVETARGTLTDGAVVIAAITSCTNTSNPAVMLAAGLLARKARARGLRPQPWVKTSLAPGSRVVTRYLERAGLLADLEALGFALVGYGCTTCIGNSGPLIPEVGRAVEEGDLLVCSVLSGNRNFEGRVNPQARANYLASPPLVVAYALAGTLDLDLTREPLGTDREGRPVHLAELWPTPEELSAALAGAVRPEHFAEEYARVFEGDEAWRALPVPEGARFAWDPASTYVRPPAFLEAIPAEPPAPRPVEGARCLVWLGDSVTTDHISPAGSIPATSPAGRWLLAQGVAREEFNSYGARRGNHEVMVRGTFGNVRLRNRLAPGTEGGVTRHLPGQEVLSVYDAAERYRAEGVPLIVLAGKDYGMGSSRDWAAKGTLLLGVRAVLAESYERIHRANLVGMGVLPLEFPPEVTPATLGLTGEERFDLRGLEALAPRARVTVRATRPDGTSLEFETRARIDTPDELDYFRHGGILPFVLRALWARGG